MATYKYSLFLSIFLMWGLSSFGTEVEDTIVSTAKDYVYVKYNIVENNGRVTISFSEIRKRLGFKNKEKYNNKLEKVCVLFFDRGGDYKDKFTSEISTEPLKVISDEFCYSQSDDGYVRLDNRTELALELLVNHSALSLPVYLAYYEGKRRYKVFAKCEDLIIPLKKQSQSGSTNKIRETVRKEIPITEQVEVASDITPAQEAALLIDNVREYLSQGPMSLAELEMLARRVDRLRDLEVIVPDKDLQSKIKNILNVFDHQMKEAKEQNENDDKAGREIANQMEKEKQAKEDLSYLQERLENPEEWSEDDLGMLKSCSNDLRRKAHSIGNSELAQEMKNTADRCDNEIKKIEEGKKQRNLLMIAGGILLCILLFIGNQVSQHFRNLRNMKSMEDTQNKIAKRAEDEALRRAQSAARSKVNRLQGQVSKKSNEIVRTKVNISAQNIGKNSKKNVTI